MERLELFKVLADESRYTIYQEVASADAPLSTAEIAERLALHPNTVRLHLEKMRDAGLLEVVVDRHGSVGRPGHRWAAVDQVRPAGPEPAGFRLLAHLLAELAAEDPLDPARVAGAGRARGRERAERRPKQRVKGGAPAACLRVTMDELTNLGFAPELAELPEPGPAGPEKPAGTGRACISFTRCPFREIAVLYPDLVCQLHRGLTEGILTEAAESAGGTARIEAFSSLVDPDPCQVEVFIGPGSP